jgi:hypothetical protein
MGRGDGRKLQISDEKVSTKPERATKIVLKICENPCRNFLNGQEVRFKTSHLQWRLSQKIECQSGKPSINLVQTSSSKSHANHLTLQFFGSFLIIRAGLSKVVCWWRNVNLNLSWIMWSWVNIDHWQLSELMSIIEIPKGNSRWIETEYQDIMWAIDKIKMGT